MSLRRPDGHASPQCPCHHAPSLVRRPFMAQGPRPGCVPFSTPGGRVPRLFRASRMLSLPKTFAMNAVDHAADAASSHASQASIWQRRCSGVLLHLTSLLGSHGIGDFGPAAFHGGLVGGRRPDGVAVAAHQPRIGPGDSPYQSVSAFAGSPLMVALEPLLAKGWLDGALLPEGGWDPRRVDFSRIQAWRLLICAARTRASWPRPRRTSTRPRLPGQATRDWRPTTCSSWLPSTPIPACVMVAVARPGLRDPRARRTGRAGPVSKAPRKWPSGPSCSGSSTSKCAAVRTYANAKGVAIMGDLPIFVAHHSAADRWPA